jgi:hypothetical protein
MQFSSYYLKSKTSLSPLAMIGERHMMRCNMDRNTPPDLVNRNGRFDGKDADAAWRDKNG